MGEKNTTGEKITVACGGCIGCRIDRSRVWAMRLIHESQLWDHTYGNSFITLTYRDIEEADQWQRAESFHVPENWGLRKSHFQKFMKRLRFHHPQKIRFFHCGEYGDRCQHKLHVDDCEICSVGRPHYHAILFNISFDDKECVGQKNGVKYYTSPKLQQYWPYGFVQVGDVNYQSVAYVARYNMKKITGNIADEHYQKINEYGEPYWVQPEYITMSRRREKRTRDRL